MHLTYFSSIKITLNDLKLFEVINNLVWFFSLSSGRHLRSLRKEGRSNHQVIIQVCSSERDLL